MIIKITSTFLATQVNPTITEISLNPEKGNGGILWYLDCIKSGVKCHELAVITNENQVAKYVCLASEAEECEHISDSELSAFLFCQFMMKIRSDKEYILIRIENK